MRLKRIIPAVAIIFCAAGFTAFPFDISSAASDALRVCAISIIPSLFPFFVLTGTVISLGWSRILGKLLAPLTTHFLRIPTSGAAAIAAGLIAGYPTGARTAVDLFRRGECTKSETEHLLSFCSNSGPAFFLSVIGAGIFGSAAAGWCLYAVHTLSALFVGFLLRPAKTCITQHSESEPAQHVTLSQAFVTSVQSSAASIVNVCGFIVLFACIIRLMNICGIISLLSEAISSCLPFVKNCSHGLISGSIELTSGILSLKDCVNSREAYAAASFITAFGGLSVHAQALSFIIPEGLSPKKYFFGKMLHALFAVLFSRLFSPLAPKPDFPSFSPVFLRLSDKFVGYSRLCAAISVIIWLIFLIFVLLNLKKDGNIGKKAL